MATLKEAIQYAQQNPNDPKSQELIKRLSSGQLDSLAASEGIDLSPARGGTQQAVQDETPTETPNPVVRGVGGFLKGALKGAGESLQNLGSLITKPLGIGGIPEESFEAQTVPEKLGKFTERVAEFAVPISKVTKATSGMSLARQLLSRAATSGAVATTQEGEVGKETAIAAGTEALLPGAGRAVQKFVVRPAGRLLKAFASGFGGISSDGLEAILENPQAARIAAQQVDNAGFRKTLEKNVKTIVDGISQIRRDSRAAYSEGLDALASTDIKPAQFRTAISSVLDSVGSVVENGKRVIQRVDFDDPKNIQRANNLIDRLSNTELDGKSLRKLIDDIESSAYKIATSDERRAFNSFVRQLSSGVRKAIDAGTDKLKEINAAYSTETQLVEAIQRELGRVKFKSLSEAVATSKKLEGLFSKSGLAPDVVDDFLTRIGVEPTAFRASEGVRQLTDAPFPANAPGGTISEVLRGITSALITPEFIRDTAINVGVADDVVRKVIERVAPSFSGLLERGLIDASQFISNDKE
jgi:hypothetical protein